jgi:hypothetical protein
VTVYAVLPIAYLVFDLLEDSWLAFLLMHRGAIGWLTSLLLQLLTAGKFLTIIASSVLVIVYSPGALYRHVST